MIRNCYKADAVSRKNIRDFIYRLKKEVGLENELYFPIVVFAENILPVLFPDYQFEVATIDEMRNKHGETYPNKNLIRIREDVYYRAVEGEGRDRLTIAHEIGHFFMHDSDSIALCRLEPTEVLKPYEDPEWQANLIKGMSEDEVAEKCGVSRSAARVQLKSL